MSSEAKNWSKTHSFGGASKKGAGSRKDLLRFLAEEADRQGIVVDAGIDWLEHETEISTKTIKRILHEFEQLDLIHRERQPHSSFEGQMVDVIVLHLWERGNKLPWKTVKQLKREKQLSRSRWGAPYEAPENASNVVSNPVDNSPAGSYPQVDMMSRFPAPVDNTPEKGHHVRFNGHGVQHKGGQGVQQRTSCPPKPSKNGHDVQKPKSAFKGTRVRTSLIDSLSVSQSLNASRPVDNFSTDRPTTYAEENSSIVRGVKLSALRSMLEAKLNISLTHISDAELGRMVIVVFSRATAPVRSPLAFAITAISTEIQELHSLAISLLEAETAQSKPKGFCYTHTREFTGTCPLCAKEASGQLKIQESESAVDGQAGAAFRDQIRARRQAKQNTLAAS
ncbi:hypothetical protein E4U03_03290 [Rothia nasimurium]|uniref:Helix-turn-helix domain-containing protein n=1 Tax=Rothia nasimurium TaxID=85336 RepID=A0A4Y9F6G9_9MICC|nr:phosphate-starvation-inducible PsiE family protein [Rothia nasimurium]MBF0807642.1 hypothetical protein [Rothia nasimurium]TFU23378.1 hypothetical protein E4U03_03290 [Rothia nasimurium]